MPGRSLIPHIFRDNYDHRSFCAFRSMPGPWHYPQPTGTGGVSEYVASAFPSSKSLFAKAFF
jgi:hypothetical protein